MTTDWHVWFEEYDDPGSSLSRRLATVRSCLDSLLADGTVGSVLSVCAGDGRDLLPELALLDRPVRALLVELDPDLSAAAREAAGPGVEVLTADAGRAATYPDERYDVVMACGVFGNIGDDDVRRTLAFLATRLTAGGRLVWTRGSAVSGDPSEQPGDRAEWVRGLLLDAGFVEERFVAPTDAAFRVGVHRLDHPPKAWERGDEIFTFVR